MASRLIVFCAALAACQAGPIWFADSGIAPGTIFIREGRAPNFGEPSIAYGFGSGLSTNIGGIQHSNAIGSTFKIGDGQAFGQGIASSDGNVYAGGVGYASTNPAPQLIYRNTYPYTYPYAYSPYNGLRRNYGNNIAVSTAQNHGYGNAFAQTHNTPYGSTASAVQSGGLRGYGPAVSRASSGGHGSAATSFTDSSGNAFSSAQNREGNEYNVAISASQNVNGITANTAHAVQKQGGELYNSGASSYQGPGIEATQSHAIKTYSY